MRGRLTILLAAALASAGCASDPVDMREADPELAVLLEEYRSLYHRAPSSMGIATRSRCAQTMMLVRRLDRIADALEDAG